MRKFLPALVAALSTTQAKAAVFSGGVAASAATVAQADPWPWLVAAAGALVVLVKFPATSRSQGVGNAVISVLLGGLGCEFVSAHLAQATGIAPGELLTAFALSAAWPAAVAAVQQLWPSLLARAQKKIGEQ
jgi:hypothetical protein